MVAHSDDSLASRGVQQQRITIVFLALAWVFILIRVWTRTYVINNFGWDDSTMVLAGLVFSTYCATELYIEANGGGTHIKDIPQLVLLTKWTVVGEATYLLTIIVLKISLGIFFARIVVKRWHTGVVWTTVILAVVSSTASLFYCLFRCGPNLDAYVLRQIANQCTPRQLDLFFAYQQAAVTTLTDIVFATLPVFILRKANMDTRSKVSVGFILSLAALGCICSIIRFQYVDGLTQFDDFYWDATNIAIWSTIEPGAGIIAGCLATFRPFLKTFVLTARSIRSSATRSTNEQIKSKQSTNNSSNVRSMYDGGVQPSNEEYFDGDKDNFDASSKGDTTIELRPTWNRNRKAESTDCILEQAYTEDTWPTQRNYSLELDRQSSRTNVSRHSSRTSRSRAMSDICSSDRSLPPLPPTIWRPGGESV